MGPSPVVINVALDILVIALLLGVFFIVGYTLGKLFKNGLK